MQKELASDKIKDAHARLDELHSEAVRSKASCRVVIELTYQDGVPQKVQDERRRYGR